MGLKKNICTGLILLMILAVCACGNNSGKKYDALDVFEFVTVNVTGIAPYASAQLEVSTELSWINEDSFTIDKTDNIKNDDVITVVCTISDDIAHEEGYNIINKQKLYYVKNVDRYVNNVEQLSGDILQGIIDEDSEFICDSTEKTDTRMLYELTGKSNYLFQYNKEWVDDLTIKDIILLTPMNYDNDGIKKNIVYIIFEAVVSNNDYSEKGYYFFRYDDAIISGNGELYINHSDPESRYMCASEYEEIYNMLIEPLKGDYYVGGVDFSGLYVGNMLK